MSAAVIAFGDCLRGSFHFDDYAMLANPGGPTWYLQTRPLTQLTFWLNFQAGGANPFGYHLVNLLLHLAVVWLLFDLARRYVSDNAAFFSAALFALHPIQSEAVAYVFARGTLLGALFCLLSWRAWRKERAWVAMAWFACALLCKEECITFPLVLLFIGPRRWRPIAAMLVLAAAVGLHTLYATQAVAGSGAGFGAGISPLAYLLAQGTVILRYARLFFVPWGFTIDPDLHASLPAELSAWCVIATSIFLWRKNPWFVAGMILLIPSSSIFPASDLAADRRVYLPLCAFSVAVGVAIQRVRWFYLAPVAIMLAALSFGRMEVWRTEQTLWSEAVERSPGKVRPAIQLARAVPPIEALDVLRTVPENFDVETERGRAYLDLGRPAEALREFGYALALSPSNPRAINNRGVALLALRQYAAAANDFQHALAIDPALDEARQNLSRARAEAK